MRLIRFRLHASRLFFAFKNTPHHHHHHHRVFTPTPTQQSRASDGGEHKNHPPPPPPPPPPAAETRGVDVLLRREKTQTQKGNDFQIIIRRRLYSRWGTPKRRDPKETTGTPKRSSGRPERRRKGTTRFVAKTKNAVAEKERWQPSVSRVDFDDDFDGGHNCPTK